jgi:hypothetical protein
MSAHPERKSIPGHAPCGRAVHSTIQPQPRSRRFALSGSLQGDLGRWRRVLSPSGSLHSFKSGGSRAGSIPGKYRQSSQRHYIQTRNRPAWLNTDAVLEQLGESKAFHEFVLSGNEAALERFYQSGRQSPVLGGEEFAERIRKPPRQLAREHPRYQRRGVQASTQSVIRRVAEVYRVSRDEVLQGVRGKENEARKVAMYLVRRCCDQTLTETAGLFGLGSYGAVGWCCHGVQRKMEKERRFKERVEKLVRELCQPKT